MHVKFLDTLDWGILIAYFLILIAIGVWAVSYTHLTLPTTSRV